MSTAASAASNHKLTKVIAGRTISGTSDSGGTKTITFSDGSAMTVKMAPSNSSSASTGGTVEKVRQSVDPPVLYLEMNGGGVVEVPLAEATSCVMLRDKAGSLEYVD